MRFEFSVAARYLLPRKGHLSQSIISLLSVFVISLIVWLVLIFLSVTEGLEKSWINKITAISAPVRLTPTESYYHSYYYQIDALSYTASYRAKSLREKLTASMAPYDEDVDGCLPASFPSPDNRDIVKETFALLTPYGDATPFEIASAELHIHLVRTEGENFLNQLAYITALEESPTPFTALVANPRSEDMENCKRLGLAATGAYKDHETTHLPADNFGREPLLFAKGLQESGLAIGDAVTITFYGTSFSGMQEMVKNGYVAGFYDSGIMPMGGRLVMARPDLVTEIRAATGAERWPQSSGLFLHMKEPMKAPLVKEKIAADLQRAGLDRYWTVESYEEYDFAKDLVQQLKSDKYLFTLIALIIILVACSNILSMLILLVNDKTKDIGILQSMGATRKSMALIFGLCGTALGLIASVIGTLIAYITLANLQTLIDLLAMLQGRNPFNTLFFGDKLPSAMSPHALIIVWIATCLLSILAGLVPAIKASRLKPTETLKG